MKKRPWDLTAIVAIGFIQAILNMVGGTFLFVDGSFGLFGAGYAILAFILGLALLLPLTWLYYQQRRGLKPVLILEIILLILAVLTVDIISLALAILVIFYLWAKHPLFSLQKQ